MSLKYNIYLIVYKCIIIIYYLNIIYAFILVILPVLLDRYI